MRAVYSEVPAWLPSLAVAPGCGSAGLFSRRVHRMIRTYLPADRDALVDLFTRAGVDSPTGELWRHAASERMVYLDPYIDNCPDTLFLAEAHGELVGYLTGCPDTALLTSEDERITQAITRHKVMLRARSMPFFLRSMVDLVRAKVRGGGAASGEAVGRWPAHLHINLAPKPAGRVSPMS